MLLQLLIPAGKTSLVVRRHMSYLLLLFSESFDCPGIGGIIRCYVDLSQDTFTNRSVDHLKNIYTIALCFVPEIISQNSV